MNSWRRCRRRAIESLARNKEGTMNQPLLKTAESRTGPLEGQLAVVTGASSGIGKGIALRLAQEGVQLCLVGRNLESLRTVAGQAPRSRRGAHLCYQADLEVERDVDALLVSLRRDVPDPDILVHVAGAVLRGPFEVATAEHFDTQYQVNLRAPYVITQGLLPSLKDRQGQVVFVNSSAGLTARANMGQYAACRHALKALADSLREEVNPVGVRVLSLFLGRTATPGQAQLHAMEGRPYRPEWLMQVEDVSEVVALALALPRTVEVTDVAMRPMRKS
jgi:NAD(P)-dependent dehydrogenase (short-subunit alcohol dehydrogenase family)